MLLVVNGVILRENKRSDIVSRKEGKITRRAFKPKQHHSDVVRNSGREYNGIMSYEERNGDEQDVILSLFFFASVFFCHCSCLLDYWIYSLQLGKD
ncbi:hypothetical protein L6452_10982 [Arctium lappa]|uniref:Uncharacterized protein n=1 Tax=Arctium lappa TaxID=4217 RepID=A0ACB9DP77_ARCLA|nr:hypothetical protein L6452_10982 [Arctium lappa]